jgi:hypothetical protein
LGYQDISRDTDRSGRELNSNEKSRRREVQKQRVYIRILINGEYVSRTRKCWIDWPSYEVNFMEKLEVYLFTKPSSIRLQIVSGVMIERTIDSFDVDIPGESVNSITSSPTLYKEAFFLKRAPKKGRRTGAKKPKDMIQVKSHKQNVEERQRLNWEEALGHDIDEEENKRLQSPEKGEPAAGEKKAEEIVEKTQEQHIKEELEKLVKMDLIEGRILYKSEWVGFGPKMPPLNADSFSNKVQRKPREKVQKYKAYYSERIFYI